MWGRERLLSLKTKKQSGGVAQLVRASACHAEGRAFESRRPRFVFLFFYLPACPDSILITKLVFKKISRRRFRAKGKKLLIKLNRGIEAGSRRFTLVTTIVKTRCLHSGNSFTPLVYAVSILRMDSSSRRYDHKRSIHWQTG